MLTIGYQTLTVTSGAAVSLTVPNGTLRAFITAAGSGGAMRFRTDGTAPTTTEGHELNAGDVLHIIDRSIVPFAVIAQTAVNGVLKITYLA